MDEKKEEIANAEDAAALNFCVSCCRNTEPYFINDENENVNDNKINKKEIKIESILLKHRV